MDDKIISFKVYFINGKYRYLYIQAFSFVNKYILTYGVYYIKKIIFYFHVTNNVLYPYKTHTITLDRLNNLFFHVIFNHFYNCQNKRIEISLEQKQYDYDYLINIMSIYDEVSELILYPNALLSTTLIT
jgi:hypothetical protein